MSELPLSVGIDATPLSSSHQIRGIGRYLDGLLAALQGVEPDWMAASLGALVARAQPAPAGVARTWRTFRSDRRPQDIDPLLAIVADRLAIAPSRPRLWHHTDPSIPWSPLRNRRTIVTVYDLIPLEVPAVMAAIRPHRRFAYRRYLDLVRRARVVIAISETTREAVTRLLGVDAGRIHVVTPSLRPPGVGMAGPRSAPSTTRDTAGAAPNTHLSYLFVGVPDPHKRPELAIDTIAELVRRGHDADLTMVGLHPALVRARLVARARTAGVIDRVAFLDRVDDATLLTRYQTATTLALSSIEGFGLPPVEAVLAGGRVIATPTAAYRETLDDHATFATRADAMAVADAAEQAAYEPVRLNVGTLADRYSPAVTASALRRAYGALGSG